LEWRLTLIPNGMKKFANRGRIESNQPRLKFISPRNMKHLQTQKNNEPKSKVNGVDVF
jgi:hypothetical protein